MLPVGEMAGILIVTLLTLQTANVLNGYTIHFFVLYVVVKLFVNAVEFVAGTVAVIKVYFCFSVTVYAPAHA